MKKLNVTVHHSSHSNSIHISLHTILTEKEKLLQQEAIDFEKRTGLRVSNKPHERCIAMLCPEVLKYFENPPELDESKIYTLTIQEG